MVRVKVRVMARSMTLHIPIPLCPIVWRLLSVPATSATVITTVSVGDQTCGPGAER